MEGHARARPNGLSALEFGFPLVSCANDSVQSS
jgi:hypothetical protein